MPKRQADTHFTPTISSSMFLARVTFYAMCRVRMQGRRRRAAPAPENRSRREATP